MLKQKKQNLPQTTQPTYIYTMEYYTEKNNILNFAGNWMELENIILKDSYHMYSLLSGF